MNREQIIAWLILEGWEPKTATIYPQWGVSLTRGVERISSDGAYFTRSLYVDYYDTAAEWLAVSDSFLASACETCA